MSQILLKKMSQTGLKKINESNRSITLIFEDNWGNKNMFKPLELQCKQTKGAEFSY